MSAKLSKEVRCLRKKVVFADYIESGSFQGGEEDTSLAGIKYNEECAVMSKKTFNRLSELASNSTAPDLLAALKDMVTANGGVSVMPTLEARQQNAALDKARAAIAKAEGKERA